MSGTVFAPEGASNASPDPLPNVLVFIAPVGSTLPDINHGGAGVTGGCSAQADLVGVVPLVYTTTDYKGAFTLASPQLNALPSGTYDLVIQAGKWRRQYPNTQILSGQVNSVGNLYMPGSAADGDLPKIAVVTGAADGIECVLQQMGIANSEVTPTTGNGHINLFQGTYRPGARSSSTSTDTEAGLMNQASVLNSYDMVMFGCQGTTVDATVSGGTTALTNLDNYANAGGRVFATHYEYVWLDKPETWASTAIWHADLSGASITLTGGTILINYTDPKFPEGKVLADWMNYVEPTAGYGNITNVHNLRNDQNGIISPPSQMWGTLQQSTGTGPVMQFTFDTPLNTASTGGSATVGLAFTNTPATVKLGDKGDGILLDVTNTSAVTANQLSLTLSVPPVLTVTSLQGANANTGWVCTVANLTCTNNALAAGVDDPISITVDVAASNSPGKQSVTATVSGVGLSSGNSACGRVMYNEYHVENGSSSTAIYPNECTTNLTPAQKFLEFSLYNLSNFISPTNTDTIQIQTTPNLTWTPGSPLYYGDLASIENATADVAGTFAYTFSPAYTGTLPDPGTYTVTATFTPADTANYLTATATRTVNMVADQTVSQIRYLEHDIFYGQEIGYDPAATPTDASVTTTFGPASYAPWVGTKVPSGSFYVTIDGVQVCSGTEQGGAVGGTRPGACPDAPFQGWNVGQHTILNFYSGTVDFLSSVSSAAEGLVTIHPDPTQTTIAVSPSATVLGSNVSMTGTVADAYIAALGTISFYDSASPTAAVASTSANPVLSGMALMGSAAVTSASQSVTLNLANLLPGTHNISVCFTSAANSVGTYNFLNSCSASAKAVVSLPPSGPLGTATLLQSSANPSVIGQSVSFTAVVGTTGAVVQVPTGTVTFYDGSTVLGTAALSASGSAVFTTSSLAAGTHTITAKYAGAGLLAASTSAALTQSVGQPLTAASPGFLLIVDPTTVPVYVGSSAIVNVQIVALTNFNVPVKLTCGGLPSEAACTVAQPTIPIGGGKTQMLITSGAPHDCNNSTPYFAGLGGTGLLSLAGVCGLTLCCARRRKLQGIALAGLLVLLPNVISGCGTGNCTDFAVKPGDYTFTLTATPQGVVTGSSAYTGTQTQPMTMHVHL